MMREEIFCLKLKKQTKGLAAPPLPGELGKKIFENISEEAWKQWLNQQTIIINENNLILSNKNSQLKLQEEMQKFLFES